MERSIRRLITVLSNKFTLLAIILMIGYSLYTDTFKMNPMQLIEVKLDTPNGEYLRWRVKGIDPEYGIIELNPFNSLDARIQHTQSLLINTLITINQKVYELYKDRIHIVYVRIEEDKGMIDKAIYLGTLIALNKDIMRSRTHK